MANGNEKKYKSIDERYNKEYYNVIIRNKGVKMKDVAVSQSTFSTNGHAVVSN